MVVERVLLRIVSTVCLILVTPFFIPAFGFDTEKWLKLWIWYPTSEPWSSRLSCERFDGGVETSHCRQYDHAIDFGREFKDEHFETKADGTFILKDEGRKVFLLAMRERMLEIHQYIELNKKRYSFFYTADQQIKRLIRAFEQQDSHLYVTVYTGEE